MPYFSSSPAGEFRGAFLPPAGYGGNKVRFPLCFPYVINTSSSPFPAMDLPGEIFSPRRLYPKPPLDTHIVMGNLLSPIPFRVLR